MVSGGDQTANFDLIGNDTEVVQVPLQFHVSHEGEQLQSLQLLQVSGDAPTAIRISREPEHGMITVNDDLSVDYTPNADFAGEDQFGYEALDDAGAVIGTAVASITVANVNDAPVALEAIAAGTVTGGSEVSVSLSAEDVDGDSLSWSVNQTAGTAVELSIAGNQLSFVAPSVDAATDLVFSAIANDGSADSNAVEVTVTVTPATDDDSSGADDETDSGSVGWLALLLLPVIGLRRRWLS
ncbi:Ig-like domain-containing protein [Ferrimonas senticii]|uniref:Ig-like domain-containing protein n=1 Tax=Ferrimonas senticii TaxID=394566 RepID=UPI000684C120|nr:Ig-like domain-containing protein [Ferrimonas senticii]